MCSHGIVPCVSAVPMRMPMRMVSGVIPSGMVLGERELKQGNIREPWNVPLPPDRVQREWECQLRTLNESLCLSGSWSPLCSASIVMLVCDSLSSSFPVGNPYIPHTGSIAPVLWRPQERLSDKPLSTESWSITVQWFGATFILVFSLLSPFYR